ncbi:MAG: DedA family protein [Deltaproteobacteria bacterium]|nr:MAG: DedA family protein [Deltaproteobacteria bacterium]
MSLEGWINWVISWAYTPYGVLALFVNAFAESSFFPVPPDLLLIALSLLRPSWALGYAAMCSVGSVLGGVLGYFLGLKGGRPLLERLISEERIRLVERYYQKYDLWAVGIAGFTPIPYKAFTISAGVFVLDLKRFVLISLVSRSARFFLVGLMIYLFGETIKFYITKYFDIFSIAFVVLLIMGFVAIRFFSKGMGRKDETSTERSME